MCGVLAAAEAITNHASEAVNRLAIVALAACGASAKNPQAPPTHVFTGGHAQAYVAIFISPEVRTAVRADLDVEPGRGMHAHFEILSGPIEWLCDGTRAWTVYSYGCSVEASCDEAVRHWFDIGWGYEELARFIAGELPDTPGWTVKHRRTRRDPMPWKSVLGVTDREFPGVVINWHGWTPTSFDLAAAIASAKALPSCAAFSPPLTPSPTTPVKP
jgi:hypothetical protein